MSTRYNDGSHYENHPAAAELQNLPAHAHRVGEQHGKQEHLTGHEQTREARETAVEARHHPQATVGHGIASFGHDDIAALANKFWIERGRPEGSPEVDWHRAVEELRARSYSHKL